MTVICPICKREFKFINNFHLKTHNLTTEEFKKLYPDYNTVSEEYHKNRSEANRKEMLNIHCNSSNEYLEQRYKNISTGTKIAWKDNNERKEKASKQMKQQNMEWLNDEEIKNKRYTNSSISLKKYWNNISEEEYNARCEAIKKPWINLSEEEKREFFKKCCKITGGKKQFIINNKEYYFRSKFENQVATYLIDNNIDFEYEPFVIKLNNDKYHGYHIIDFYLPKYNLILEPHANQTASMKEKECKEDIKIKCNSAIELGYNYEVIWYTKNIDLLHKSLSEAINKYK